MSTRQDNSAAPSIRIVSMRARDEGAPETAFAPGLNIVSGADQTDIAAIRSAFDALTHPMRPSVHAVVEVDGHRVEVDEQFADQLTLAGVPAPVLDLATLAGSPSVPSESGRSAPDPSAQNETRAAQLRQAAANLRSELELVRRESERTREDPDPPDATATGAPRREARPGGGLWGGPGARMAESSLHPADVAVMCDRLRDLHTASPDPGLAALAERLELAGAQRVYAIHREEALDQLVAECNDAIRSAEEFLAVASAGPVEAGENDPDRILAAGARQARTIARIDLLSELAEFWRQRRETLDELNEAPVELLARANSVLEAAGLPRVPSPARAAASLRELAGSAQSGEELKAIEELTEALRAFLGSEARDLSGAELVALAESRLAAGRRGEGSPSPRPQASGARSPGSEPNAERLEQLSVTERRLVEELQVVTDALSAIERGQQVLEAGRTRPNPFDGDAGAPEPHRSAEAGISERIEALRSLRNSVLLPVLVIEPTSGAGHDSPSELPDPAELLEAARRGQVVWITARDSVLSSAATMGDALNLIEV